ncbi:glycosyltransferase family 4 protein [Treponema sp. OMZ 787]|uniref:glycosyltransferase family 4 protein n=1 Tax=Treponema sp. OMZ 787 TaxID=2563669 RepID=UPI0020A2C9FC|nr:glycosyltransferase family 4 protein [Treponema sp. OMZ 787]UTC61776.1 glycosyltransferase family 4 protein [Treponema sp. OMZ 787]
MRIGIFTDCYYPQINGVVTSTMNLQKELEKLNHEVYIITTTFTDFKDEDERHIIRIPSIPFFKWSEFKIGLFLKYTKSYNKVKALNFDIIHTQTEFSMGNFGTFIAKDLNIPSLHTYHTVYEEYTHYILPVGKKPLKKIVRKLSKHYVAPFSGVIAPTEKTKKLLISYGVKNKIYVVPSGINIEKFQVDIPKTEIDSLLKSFNIKSDSFKILFLGRISKEKNIETLINIIPKIIRENKNIQLIIVGDGPDRLELEARVKDLGLEDSIIFTNRIPNDKVPIYYKIADIFISPSKTETQGLTILEAMAAGVPVLVYDDTNVKGIVLHKKTGLLFKENNELLDNIKFALNNKEEIKKYAKEAFKVADNFSSANFAKKIEKIYKELIN